MSLLKQAFRRGFQKEAVTNKKLIDMITSGVKKRLGDTADSSGLKSTIQEGLSGNEAATKNFIQNANKAIPRANELRRMPDNKNKIISDLIEQSKPKNQADINSIRQRFIG